MPDREKVIKGLPCLTGVPIYCETCPYSGEFGFGYGNRKCAKECASDALELLKEQDDMGKELGDAVELIHKKNERIEQLNRFVNGFSRDAIPVVRCKDCKHWKQSNGHCPFNSIFTNADWFCADGVKKDA